MTEPAFVLDTNVYSDLLKARPDVGVRENFDRSADAAATTAVTWHELLYGMERLPAGRRRREVEQFLRDVVAVRPILPYDDAAAQWHSEERARLERTGRIIPYVDGQIAAIAATNRLVLVTHNGKDFAGLRGIHLVDWHAGR